ncbi:hypothetical protein WDU94_010159 [Cyamophila willieti]
MKHFHSKKLKFVEQFGVRDHHIKGITAEEEYKKNPDLKKEDVQALRTWMTTQAHLPQDAPVLDTLGLQREDADSTIYRALVSAEFLQC